MIAPWTFMAYKPSNFHTSFGQNFFLLAIAIFCSTPSVKFYNQGEKNQLSVTALPLSG